MCSRFSRKTTFWGSLCRSFFLLSVSGWGDPWVCAADTSLTLMSWQSLHEWGKQEVQCKEDGACCAARFTILWIKQLNSHPLSKHLVLIFFAKDCSDIISQTVPISVNPIYPIFLMGLGDRLKQKYLHVFPYLWVCTQTQCCMAWLTWVKKGGIRKLWEAPLLCFAPCRPFLALLNLFPLQPFFQIHAAVGYSMLQPMRRQRFCQSQIAS